MNIVLWTLIFVLAVFLLGFTVGNIYADAFWKKKVKYYKDILEARNNIGLNTGIPLDKRTADLIVEYRQRREKEYNDLKELDKQMENLVSKIKAIGRD